MSILYLRSDILTYFSLLGPKGMRRGYTLSLKRKHLAHPPQLHSHIREVGPVKLNNLGQDWETNPFGGY